MALRYQAWKGAPVTGHRPSRLGDTSDPGGNTPSSLHPGPVPGLQRPSVYSCVPLPFHASTGCRACKAPGCTESGPYGTRAVAPSHSLAPGGPLELPVTLVGTDPGRVHPSSRGRARLAKALLCSERSAPAAMGRGAPGWPHGRLWNPGASRGAPSSNAWSGAAMARRTPSALSCD